VAGPSLFLLKGSGCCASVILSRGLGWLMRRVVYVVIALVAAACSQAGPSPTMSLDEIGTAPTNTAVPTVILQPLDTATPDGSSPPAHTATVTPAPFPDDPVDAARLYYETINEGSYALAWSMLTDNFQQNSNQDDFKGYVEFWMKSSPVTLDEVVLEDTIGLFEAHVRVRLFYVGGVDESSNLHILVRDSINFPWRIDQSIP